MLQPISKRVSINGNQFILKPLPARQASSYTVQALSLLAKGDAKIEGSSEAIGLAVIFSALSNPSTKAFVDTLIDEFSRRCEVEICGDDGVLRTPRVSDVFDQIFQLNQKSLWIWVWENLKYNFSDFLDMVNLEALQQAAGGLQKKTN